MFFSKRIKDLETISKNKATEKAALELGLKFSYQESKEEHLLPKEHFKFVVVDLKNISPETKTKFEELQKKYQQEEYQKITQHISKKVLRSLSILVLGVSALTLITCERNKSEKMPKLIQKATPVKGYNYPYSHAREK